MPAKKSPANRRPKTTGTVRGPWRHTPTDMVDLIFSFLPIRNAARNALLSKKFAGSWRRSRTLDFDRHFCRKLRRNGANFAATVRRVLGAHTGDEIRHLKLYFDHSTSEPGEVGSWVRTSSEKGLKIIDLDFRESDTPYFVAADLLDVETLEEIKLRHCHIPAPLTLTDGLRRLRSLVLRKVFVGEGATEQVVERCPELETLDVALCSGFQRMAIEPAAEGPRRLKTVKFGGCPGVRTVIINVTSVRTLFYDGDFQRLTLTSFGPPRIEEAVIDLKPVRACCSPWFRRVEPTLRWCLSDVSVLTTSSSFLEDLSPDQIHGTAIKCLNFTLPNLKEFQLVINKPSYSNLFYIAAFLINCPSLENLIIDLTEFKFEPGLYWESHLLPGLKMFDESTFDSLKLIKLNGFKFVEHENEIVQFLLKKTPVLETLALIHPRKRKQMLSDLDEIEEFTTLFETWKLSLNATIHVSVWWKDTTQAPKHLKTWYS